LKGGASDQKLEINGSKPNLTDICCFFFFEPDFMLCVCHTTKLFCLHVFRQNGPSQWVDCLTPREDMALIACLHDQNKSGFFWRAGFFPANQNNLKSF